MSEDLTKGQFVSFYNHAVGELTRLLKIEAEKM